MISLFAAATVTAVGILTWRKSLWGIASVLVLLPTYVFRFSVAGIPTTVLEVALLTVVVVVLIQKLLHKPSITIPSTAILVWGGLLCAIGLLALWISPDMRAAAGIFKAYILEPILFAIAASMIVRSKQDVLKLFVALTIPAAAIAITACVQYVGGWGIPDPWQDWSNRRSTALYGYPNAVGLFLAPIIAGGFALLIHRKNSRRLRWWLGLVIVLGILALFAARADGAIAAIAVAMLVALLFTRWRVVALIAAGLALIAALAVPASRDVLLFQDTSGQVRLAIWQGTAALIVDNPLNGAGLSGFQSLYDDYRLMRHTELPLYPHNTLFNFWTELGFSGMVWIVGTLSALLTIAKRLIRFGDRDWGIWLLTTAVACVVYGLVDVPYWKNDLSVLFWFTLMSAVSLYTIRVRQG